jgi:transglutaminase-like putative cysteine protease
MRRSPITALIVLLALVFAVTGWRLFAHSEAERFGAVDAVRNSASYIRLTMRVSYPGGPIATEEYQLVNDNGNSRATYTVGDRKGTIATFDEILHGYDVTFAFDKMVRDGIWELDSKHPRTNADTHYTVTIAQTVQGQSGHRTFAFTDPKYWAVAAGRQYHITLDPKKPTPSEADLLHLESTSIADPRYLKIVDDFLAFGSPAFHRTVASARAKLLRS